MAAFEPSDDIILAELMSKKGHLIKNWKQRYVVLRPYGVEYFTDPTMKVKKGEILINEMSEVEGRIGSTHEFKFTVSTGSKNLTIAAPSPETRDEWMENIRTLIQCQTRNSIFKELSSSTPSDSLLHRKKKTTAKPKVTCTPSSRSSIPSSKNASFSEESRGVESPSPAPISESSTVRPSDTSDDGWEMVTSAEGTYYYHKKTRVSRWTKPDDDVSAAIECRLKEVERTADEGFKARKEDMELRRLAEEEKRKVIDTIKPEIILLITAWREEPDGSPKDLASLINTLPSILPHLSAEVASGRLNIPISEGADVGEIKRAYFKAVRFLHPDKLPGSLELAQRMIAEHAFAYLSEVFQAYREIIATEEER